MLLDQQIISVKMYTTLLFNLRTTHFILKKGTQLECNSGGWDNSEFKRCVVIHFYNPAQSNTAVDSPQHKDAVPISAQSLVPVSRRIFFTRGGVLT